ncbi:MAG TPA: cobalamin-dependent protein [Gammaproteobacteria bacterium]
MTEANTALAEIIEASAPGYASASANLLLTGDASLRDRYGPGASTTWRAHLQQRLLELAAAVRMGEPRLFANRMIWQQKAFTARESGSADLRLSLQALGDVLAEELPEELRDTPAPYLQAGLDALEVAHEPEKTGLDPNDPHGSLALAYLLACLEGDVRRAIRLLERAQDNGTPVEDLFLEVLVPVQQEIGRMWHANEVSIAEERIVSETTRKAMTLLTERNPVAKQIDKTVLAASVALNTHDIGIRAVADFFQLAGWHVLSLGPDVPPSEVANAAEIFNVDLVLLGATLSTQLKQLTITIDHIKATCGDRVKILVGGHVFLDAPELWRTTGADAYAADARDAVRLGAELVGLDAPAK